MDKKATDYPEDITELSKSVLLEVMTLLKEYSKSLVLVGGWVPYFLLKRFQKNKEFQHVGSADIDLVIDPELIKINCYRTIADILKKNGYKQSKDDKFSYERDINGDTINVDFISADYPEETDKILRHVQHDLMARTSEGAKIALKHNYEEEMEGVLPNKAKVKIKIKIADIVGSLITKALALGGRSKTKDNYDIYALITNYKYGETSCAEEIKPFLDDQDIKEPIEVIKKKFKTETSLGSVGVGDFLNVNNDIEYRNRIITDSFMRVNKFLELLK